MQNHTIAIDAGTTSVRAILFDETYQIIHIESQPLQLNTPNPGWVEQNGIEILNKTTTCLNRTLSHSTSKKLKIKNIGITNQRETAILWDTTSGIPLGAAISWQDIRTKEMMEDLSEEDKKYIQSTTGLVPDTYFSGSKISWMLENYRSSDHTTFGTVDSWLLWNLSEEKNHFTDHSNASRTLLYSLHNQTWDTRLLEIFKISKNILPEIKDNAYLFGHYNFEGELIPITGMIGDQQSALYGQSCTTYADTKNTYGTGCFMLTNTGKNIIESTNGLLSTVAWRLNNSTIYALEGSVFMGGATIQWLRDGLEMITSAEETEALAASSDFSNDIIFIPSFQGLGTPYWNKNVKGAIVNMEYATGKAEIARAALEAIAFQTVELASSIEKDIEQEITSLKVDGGASKNRYLMQFQANILQKEIAVLQDIEATALGAAKIANAFYNQESTASSSTPTIFNVNWNREKANSKMDAWQKAIKTLLSHHS